jgi:hypothetical protein
MSTQVQYRRGTAEQNDAFTGALAEITVDVTNLTLRVHDGINAGGSRIATELYVDSEIGNISTSTIDNGTSNVQVVSSGGNIVSTVGGSVIQTISSNGSNISGAISATGNITGANVSGTNLTGTLTTAAQPNVTSVGTLTSLAVTGNATTGNVSGTTVTGTTVKGGNITVSGDLISGSGTTITIDPATAGPGGLVIIDGNLQVTGTTTTIDSTTVTINDLMINVANNAANAAQATGAGIGVGPVGAEYATWTYSSGTNVWTTAQGITATGNVTGGNLITAGLVSLSSIIKSGTDGAGNIGQSDNAFDTVFAKSTSAQYADLAEMYVADVKYEPGTVIEIGGLMEVTQTTALASTRVCGIVSTNPAYLMNSSEVSDTAIEVALVGRVPCRVIGKITRGDLLCSSTVPGVACSLPGDSYLPGCVVGKALSNYDSSEVGVIEVLAGRL